MFQFGCFLAQVKNHLNTGLIFQHSRRMMLVLHCAAGCQWASERWNCRINQRGWRCFDVQPVCSNWKAAIIISERWETQDVSAFGSFTLPSFLCLASRWGSKLTTQLFLHASDALHVHALCEYFLSTSSFPFSRSLCARNSTMFAATMNSMRWRRALLLQEKKKEKEKKMSLKSGIETDVIWLLD